MKRLKLLTAIALAALLAFSGAMNLMAGDPAPAGAPVAVTVNGQKIMESQVDDFLDQTLPPGLPPEQFAAMRAQYHDKVLDLLIEDALFHQKAKDAKFTMTDADYKNALRKEMDQFFETTGADRKDFEARVTEKTGLTMDQYLEKRLEDPLFKQVLFRAKLVETLYGDKLKVSEEKIKSYYDESKDTKFTTPERVRASHILITTKPTDDEKTRAAALETAKKVHDEAVKPGADFAALAMKYSGCPSKEKGGDLGYFTRDKMVKPFADKAFTMKPGEISDIVETQFGYHVILLTDREPGKTLSFAEAKPLVERKLKNQKLADEEESLSTSLRESAKIVYPTEKVVHE